ncbi:peptidylprolyl isomerase [Streptomyces sp. Ac-502]|uniref:peptidylprolyl isomerase n=1 Tax=Streptomyces sp. Ac-502 TaxID=3342801 RepID=UPI003862543B
MSDPAPRVLLDTSFGPIEIELNSEKAPVTAKNFLEYVGAGLCNNTVFHRVIPASLALGRGFTDRVVQESIRADQE